MSIERFNKVELTLDIPSENASQERELEHVLFVSHLYIIDFGSQHVKMLQKTGKVRLWK